jgi:hypothetical protein
MTTDPMPRHFRQTLAELELISHGTTARWNPTGGEGEAAMPPGESQPPHLTYRHAWQTATPARRHTIEKAAAHELERLRGHGITNPHDRPSVTVETKVIAATGYQAEHVAESTGLAANHVRRIRQRVGQDPETGLTPIRQDPAAVDPQRVLELHAQGCTHRQIGTIVGVSKSTVERIIKNAA